MSEPQPKWPAEPPAPPAEYLDQIRHWLGVITDQNADDLGENYRWTDAQLSAYAKGGGWGGFYQDGYAARAAVLEDMSCWEE